MTTKKKTPAPRGLARQSRKVLESVKKRLIAAMGEKARAEAQLSLLAIEIPALENTIRALTAQLSPGTDPIALSPRIAPNVTMPFVLLRQATGTDGWPAGRKEVDDSMGSIPVSGEAVDEPVEDINTPPDLDSLPQFSGNFR